MNVREVSGAAPIWNARPDNLKIVFAKGKEIAPYVDRIVDLHLNVYREAPFFYEGNREEYTPLIQAHADSEEGLACLLFEKDRLVGSATGMPLKDMPDAWTQNFKGPIERTFYLGDELLLEEYRGKHLGSELYRRFEKDVPSTYDTLAFIRLDDPIEHPLNEVMMRRGFIEHPDWTLELPWRDVHSKEVVNHPLIYWTKKII